jgi:hypothetical protein
VAYFDILSPHFPNESDEKTKKTLVKTAGVRVAI